MNWLVQLCTSNSVIFVKQQKVENFQYVHVTCGFVSCRDRLYYSIESVTTKRSKNCSPSCCSVPGSTLPDTVASSPLLLLGQTECRMQWTVKHWRTRYKKVSTVDIEKLNLTVSFHAGAARASHGFTEKSRRPVRWSLCTMVLASPVHTGITGIDIHLILTHVFWHAFLKVSTDKAVSSGSCSSVLNLIFWCCLWAHLFRHITPGPCEPTE